VQRKDDRAVLKDSRFRLSSGTNYTEFHRLLAACALGDTNSQRCSGKERAPTLQFLGVTYASDSAKGR